MKFAFVLIILLLAIMPLNALGQDNVPTIEILEPADGERTGTSTNLVVTATGYDLRNADFSITERGSNVATGSALDCSYMHNTGTGLTYMKCDQEINLKSFAGKNVILTASVEERNSGRIKDSVELYVSEKCVQGH
ncbi:MAG: hypothetical protein JW754_02625 [Candidatus Aenigmarchaeota archaeon]|nr:hypothetical protein [Candidatus Aenigmarchaeota archaeon]